MTSPPGAKDPASSPSKRNLIFMATAVALTIAAAITTYAWQNGSIATEPPITPGQSAEEAARIAGFDDRDKAAIEAIVRDYIMEHPEILPDAMQVLRQRQTAAQIKGLHDEIVTPYAKAFAGNPDGDVVLAEYSDFACGFCRASVADVKKLLEDDPKLKVVFHELPILSDESGTAAEWAMAAAEQGKYIAFHDAMFAAGRPSSATIQQAATKAGLDMDAARKFVASDAGEKTINKNIEIARQLSFSGTPSWVIGDQVLSGAVGYDALKKAIAEARKGAGS